VPLPLQQKAIDYARYQALLSAPVSQTDLPRADRYMASFEAGLKKATVNERNIAGPITLVMQPGYWDLDPETAHL
jgi:multidrug resistance efflux pump